MQQEVSQLQQYHNQRPTDNDCKEQNNLCNLRQTDTQWCHANTRKRSVVHCFVISNIWYVRKIRFQYVPHMLARDFRHLPMYPMSMPAKWQRPRDYAKWDHKDPCQCRSRQLPKSSRLGMDSPRGMRELMDCVLWVSCTWCLHGMLCDMPVNGMEI